MKISVLGLGYVGAVSAGCLAQDGHEVIGVDPERTKVDLINSGRSPIIEKGIGEIVAEQVAAGRLRASTDVSAAVRHTDLVLVCVGTPSQANGGIDLKFIRRVCEQIRASGDLLDSLYASMPGPRIRTDIQTAEMVKYADNVWHALKVGFANE